MFGDIYLCEFPFTSGLATKKRPVLVLFDLQNDALVCRITSVARSDNLDIALSDWKAAGLLKPSVARLNRLVTAEKKVFLKQLGTLSNADAEKVRSGWNLNMTL